MSRKTGTAVGLVLKLIPVGETDAMITLLTQERGKLVCRANGIRTLKSTKRSALQPGNLVKCYWLETKNMPLITQAMIANSYVEMDQSLPRYRQLSQLLELCERLFIESELETEIFEQVLLLRLKIAQNVLRSRDVQASFRSIITTLGYQDPEDSKYETISDYVSALADKPIRSYTFLKVQT